MDLYLIFFLNDYNLSVSQKNKYRCFEKYIRIEFEFEERADVEFFSPRNVTINAFLSQLREIEIQQRYSDDCPLYKMLDSFNCNFSFSFNINKFSF